MAELMTEDTQSGTRVRLESDRPFDRQAGDSVMRALGFTEGGEPVFDAAYVEASGDEARVIAYLCRQTVAPTSETQDRIGQEIQALFGSKLSGRDAAQIAEIVGRAQWEALLMTLGVGEHHKTRRTIEKLAERFERASARVRAPYGESAGDEKAHTGPRHRAGNGT